MAVPAVVLVVLAITAVTVAGSSPLAAHSSECRASVTEWRAYKHAGSVTSKPALFAAALQANNDAWAPWTPPQTSSSEDQARSCAKTILLRGTIEADCAQPVVSVVLPGPIASVWSSGAPVSFVQSEGVLLLVLL